MRIPTLVSVVVIAGSIFELKMAAGERRHWEIKKIPFSGNSTSVNIV